MMNKLCRNTYLDPLNFLGIRLLFQRSFCRSKTFAEKLTAIHLSGTAFANLLNVSVKKSDLEQRNALFMEDYGATYLKKMFETALATAAS